MHRTLAIAVPALLLLSFATTAHAGCPRFQVERQETTIAPELDCVSIDVFGADFCGTPFMVVANNCEANALVTITQGEALSVIPDPLTVVAGESFTYTMRQEVTSEDGDTVAMTINLDGTDHEAVVTFVMTSDFGEGCSVTRLPATPGAPGLGAALLALLALSPLARRRS